MINENFSNVKVHIISGRVKLEQGLLEEMIKYGKQNFNSAEVDFKTGELILETFTLTHEN